MANLSPYARSDLVDLKSIPHTAAPPSAVVSASDPGAIGAYRDWFNPATSVVRKRNATNDAWTTVYDPGTTAPAAHAASHESGGDDELELAESQVTGLVADLASKAAASHTHAQSDVTNLTTDLAAKASTAYVDAAVAGLSWKQSVRCKTTANVDLAGGGLANGTTHDGVTVATGDRVLVASQSTGAENGIYLVPASGAASRSTDTDSAADILQASVYVQEGTANADTQWVLSTNAPITLGSTSLTFTQLSSGGVTGSGTTTKLAKFTGSAAVGDSAVTENTADLTTTKPIILPASTTAIASLRAPHGSAPTSPVDGDWWTTSAGAFVRINGVTVGPLGAAGASLPNGGNINEVLAKISASNGDAGWRHSFSVESVAPGGGSDLEFNSSTIGGTALGSPSVIDADTTVKGALYISAAANASFGMNGQYWTLAGLSLSLPLTIDAEITDWENYGNFCRHALLIAEATPGKTMGIYIEHVNATAARLNTISTISSSTPTTGAAYVDTGFAPLASDGATPPIELRIVAASSSSVSYYYRPRGSVIWRTIRTAHNPGFTIGAIAVTSNPESASFGVKSIWSHIRFS